MVGGDIHYDNPAEEVNLFDAARPGRNYGYPFCWSEGIWMDATMAKGPEPSTWIPISRAGSPRRAARTRAVVVPPAFALGAHLAPLDIVEYRGNGYPAECCGDLFVASHGSWNRETAPGRPDDHPAEDGRERSDRRRRTSWASPTVRAACVQGSWAGAPGVDPVDQAGLLTFSDDASGTVKRSATGPDRVARALWACAIK